MAKVIITGPTGNAGSAILNQALASSSIAQITTLSRRAPFTTHSKLTSILLPSAQYPTGFDSYPETLISELKDHSAVIWALGISQLQVDKAEYVDRITHEYTLAAAKAFKEMATKEKPFRFIYVSGEGADQTEKARALFGRIKGRTEKELNEMDSEEFQVLSIRPGGIIPTDEHRPRMGTLMQYVWPVAGWATEKLYPSMAIRAADLGSVCVEIATGTKGWDRKTSEGWIDNKVLKQIAVELKSS